MSTKFTAYARETGRVLFQGTASSPHDIATESQDVFIGEAYTGGWLEGEVHHEQPAQPSGAHVFDWTTKQWYDPRTLQDLKDTANNTINSAWDQATLSGFTYLSKEFSTTPSSRSDIDGINGYVALYNAFPEGWVGAWKAKDSTYLPITSTEEWKAFYTAMVVAGLSNFSKAQQLKAQLAAATTPEEVEAVVW